MFLISKTFKKIWWQERESVLIKKLKSFCHNMIEIQNHK